MNSQNQIKHIAIVMDGNRRWARENKILALEGHRRGYEKLKDVARWCIEEKIPYLTVFGFSTENWGRNPSEVRYLMDLLRVALRDDIDEYNKEGVRVKIIGQRERFEKDIQGLIENVERRTQKNPNLVFQLAISYGGKADIAQAVRKIAQKVKQGTLQEDDIGEKDIESHLWTAGIPDPDLMIRTGGEIRESNFLIWQLAYAEFFFTPTYWPAFSREEFTGAIEEFYRRQRRYGK